LDCQVPSFACCEPSVVAASDVRGWDRVRALFHAHRPEPVPVVGRLAGQRCRTCCGGLPDGTNDAGLAVSLTWGVRSVHGRGFAVLIVVRCLLTTCDSVDPALALSHRSTSHR
jgi:hypothetical protein